MCWIIDCLTLGMSQLNSCHSAGRQVYIATRHAATETRWFEDVFALTFPHDHDEMISSLHIRIISTTLSVTWAWLSAAPENLRKKKSHYPARIYKQKDDVLVSVQRTHEMLRSWCRTRSFGIIDLGSHLWRHKHERSEFNRLVPFTCSRWEHIFSVLLFRC